MARKRWALRHGWRSSQPDEFDISRRTRRPQCLVAGGANSVILQAELTQSTSWTVVQAFGESESTLVANIITPEVECLQLRIRRAAGQLMSQHNGSLVAQVHALKAEVGDA